MKLFKKLVYVLGIIVLASGILSGYFTIKKHSYKKQLAQAKICYESGDAAKAIDILEALHKKNPGHSVMSECVYLLAKYYVNIGETEKAENCWNDLLGLDKERYGAESLFNLAGIYKDTDRADIALKNYNQIIDEYPDSDFADDSRLNIAVLYRVKGELKTAQSELNAIIEKYPDTNLISTVEKELGKVNVDLLFSSEMTEGSIEYIVKEGDSLFIIAQKNSTTVDLLKRCNKLKSDFIKPKDKLKIITEKFSLVADKSKNILTLKLGERVVKVYPVGTGTGGSTPAGTYKITNKITNPPWHKPGEGIVPFGDPKNVLGTRWMGFNNQGYGIHGTWEPDSIGKQSSAGCIRLLNEDVEELFQIVPVGTEVTIIE